MLVKIVLRTPGNHTQIAKMKMDAVPHTGDSVILNDVAREVVHVSWNLTENSVSVLVKEPAQ